MTTKTNKTIVLIVVIIICVVLGSILIPKRKHSTSIQKIDQKMQVSTNNLPKQIKPELDGKEKKRQPHPTEVLQANNAPETKIRNVAENEHDPSLEWIATEIIEQIKPIEWKKREFDGMPKRFSKEDFQKAKKLISRFNDNYAKINSFSFHEIKKTVALVNDEATKASVEKRKGADNHSFDIEFTRDPIYFKMKGLRGDGEELEEIITPVGKISSGHFGRGASWIPTYTEGQKFVVEAAVLKYGERVRKNVTMNYKLPLLDEIVRNKNIKPNNYDVIEDTQDDRGFCRTYWFNKETGMLDFNIGVKLNPKEDEPPFFDATVIDYYHIDGVYYPKHVVICGKNYRVKCEENITNLVINGKEAQ